MSEDYALRAVVAIANQRGSPCSAPKIARTTQIPSSYLSKLMQRLVQVGLVYSRRGTYGGFLLAIDPAELSIWDVVVAVESINRTRRGPIRISSHKRQLCPLHHRLDKALEMLEEQLRGTMISELLTELGGGDVDTRKRSRTCCRETLRQSRY